MVIDWVGYNSKTCSLEPIGQNKHEWVILNPALSFLSYTVYYVPGYQILRFSLNGWVGWIEGSTFVYKCLIGYDMILLKGFATLY